MDVLPQPFRLLDPSGRSLIWIKINDEKYSVSRPDYESDSCRIAMCPRSHGSGSPPDIVTRPCHSYNGTFFRLKDEVHGWLAGIGMERRYQFEFRYVNGAMTPAWHVGFLEADGDKAALFKLAWPA